MPERRISRHELARCNGKGGAPVFIAYQGKVYDLSGSFLWHRGKHQVVHKAGADLTASLALAPHGPELLERFPMVGLLEDAPF